ncbi:MAG: hypothetical protein EOM59_14525 [Clostridia bacterium]|nr:hypothetical protein [Clostridia bacterium]
MQIQYDNSKIEKLFSDFIDIKSSKNLMQKGIGLELTKKVKIRYNQLSAAENLQIYFSTALGKPEILKGNLMPNASVCLNANYRLIFEPLFPKGQANVFVECKIVIIKGVVDYHGQGSHTWLIP